MKLRYTIRINQLQNYFLCLLALFPFFEPRIFFNYAPFRPIDKIYLMAQVLAFVILAIKYILSKKFSWCIIGISLFRIVTLISTLIAAHRIDIGWFSKTIVIVGAAIGIELLLRKDAVMTLKCLYIIMFIPLVINSIMCILGISFSNGGTQYYFIGIRTQFPNTMIPIVIIAFILSYIEKGTLLSKPCVVTIIICLIQLVVQWVGTGLILFVILIGMILLLTYKKGLVFFNAPILFASSVMLNILIVFARVQDLFAFIIVDMLHKDLTFTGRTPIWDYAIKTFKNSPILGYGELGTGGFVKVYWANRPAPAHNTILQVLHDGGLFSLTCLILVVFYATFVLYKNRKEIISSVLAIGIFINGIEMISEVLHYQIYFFLLIILACNIRYILPKPDKYIISYINTKRRN